MAGNGKKVLLHACCGPCSIMCIQSLRDEGYDVTGYFANPNICLLYTSDAADE